MPPHVLTRLTIATRLLWSFLVIALVPLSIVTYLTYTISDQSLREEVTNSLRAIADSKPTRWRPTRVSASATSPHWPACQVLLMPLNPSTRRSTATASVHQNIPRSRMNCAPS